MQPESTVPCQPRLPSLGERAEQIYVRFEDAWKEWVRGGPAIGPYLAEVPEAERPVLLPELLMLDIQLRGRLGDRPTREDYRGRLPAHAELIDGLFAEMGTVDSGARPSSPTGAVALDGSRATHGGRFRILRFHARGGLGQVHVALDEELHREVALKEVQADRADDPDSRARFLLEAEITGGLEHPGIVPVYGLGHDESGRPYYAMRFIRGHGLDEAIARFHEADRVARNPGERAVELRRLLGRFIDACNAVGYAHSRGVIHRDLKPSNVMLGEYGETLVVDWGLAKSTGRPGEASGSETGALFPPLSDRVAPTQTGRLLGTPAYMSPEQASGDPKRIGPRGDVYSLGATLYHLLTGRAAFEGKDIGEVLRRVRSGDFPPPRRVNPRVPPALDAICRKAMAPRPEDRYAAATGLAGDVERWLADQVVSAYREPALARARRWVRRHRTLATSAAAVLLVTSLVAGLFSAALLGKNRLLDRRLRWAEEREELAIDAVSKFRDTVQGNDTLRDHPGLVSLRKQLLQEPLEFFRTLKGQLESNRETRPEVLHKLAQVDYNLALTTAEISSVSNAIRAYEEAIVILRRLARDYPAAARYQGDLADSYNNLGILYGAMGRSAEAEAAYGAARDILERLARDHPDVADYRSHLAKTYTNLGGLFRSTGRSAEAEAVYGAARATWEHLVADHPGIAEYQDALAGTRNNLGALDEATGRSADAEAAYLAAMAIEGQLARDHPDVAEYRRELALSHINLGGLYQGTGRAAQAGVTYEAAREILEPLARDHPDVVAYQSALARSHNNLGVLYQVANQLVEAEAAYRAALAIEARLARDHPDVVAYRSGVARSHNNLGALYMNTGRMAEAEGSYKTAMDLRERLARDHPDVPEYAIDLGGSYCNMAGLICDRGQPREAIVLFDRAIVDLEKVLASDPRQEQARQFLRNVWVGRANALDLLGRYKDAAVDWARAIELDNAPAPADLRLFRARSLALAGSHRAAANEAEDLVADSTLPAASPYNLACVLALASAAAHGDVTLTVSERAEQAESHAARAVALLERAGAAGFFRDPANLNQARDDADLDPLRSRSDFRSLLLDLAFPTKPFATDRAQP